MEKPKKLFVDLDDEGNVLTFSQNSAICEIEYIRADLVENQRTRSNANGGSEMSESLKIIKAATELYKAPFKHIRGYIYDADGHMVADDAGGQQGADAILRIRGWGRIGYMPDAEKVQDTVAELIVAALNKYWTEQP